ncbi:drug/metabolite transporter (DMT)-like permease [Rhodanobacter sp. K2T2]|uniref:DMT family transporter n=1 Tax=Rhodanobacter sp. K2T2 TaxID=2723085 RepID=UPI0015C8F505|nr:EamA family transporter [Rhodanobacter sp. K2T2]NYE29021.1 drug/metabolite transporter (DMT)-like permease [Rhodanobacter sp. K2T2]
MPTSSSSQRGAVFAMLATILIWAYSWIVMKQVLAYAGPFDFAALRYLLGAAVLFIVLVIARQPLRPPPLLLTIGIGVFQTAAFQGLGQWALRTGGAGHVALLAYTMPFWAVLLAWLMLGDRPTRRHVIGLALAAVGLLCIIEPWRAMGSVASTALAIAAGICWAVGTVLTKRMFLRHKPSVLNLTAWQMLAGGIALGIVALLVPQRPIAWTGALIAGVAYSVVIASSIAWWLWSIVLQRLPTTVASLSSLGVPIVSVLLAWGILHERPSLIEWVGIAFVVAGLAAVSGVGTRSRG